MAELLANPPIDEVVVGVHFAPIEKLQPVMFQLWHEVKDHYPEFQEQPPVVQTAQSFGPPAPPQPVILRMDYQRLWFLTADGTRLLQVQRDFFASNWRKVKGDEIYSGFEQGPLSDFQRGWERFLALLKQSNLGPPSIVHCEVTYINMLPQGDDWRDFSDLAKIIAPWSGKFTDDKLPVPEQVAITAAFLMTERKGRLSVAVNPVIRGRDKKYALQIALTARCAPDDLSDVGQTVSLCHGWTERGFGGLVDPAVFQKWR